MTQHELMEKIIEKLNEGGIYNTLELADIFNISIIFSISSYCVILIASFLLV